MNESRPIRIVLIDDHTLFRSGIKALLARQSGFEVVGEASDGLSGIKTVRQTDPDIVLVSNNHQTSKTDNNHSEK